MEGKTIRGIKIISKDSSPDEWHPTAPVLGIQQALFPFQASNMLVFVSVPRVKDGFVAILDQLRPGVIVELRQAPTFDYGNLNRKAAFHHFGRIGSRYVDLVPSGSEAAFDSDLAGQVRAIISDHVERESPYMFLVGGAGLSNGIESILKELSLLKVPWNVCLLPPSEEQGAEQRDETTLPASVEKKRAGVVLCFPSGEALQQSNGGLRGCSSEQSTNFSSYSAVFAELIISRAHLPAFLSSEDEPYLEDDFAARVIYDRPCWEERWK
jgi:hypothetical protein